MLFPAEDDEALDPVRWVLLSENVAALADARDAESRLLAGSVGAVICKTQPSQTGPVVF